MGHALDRLHVAHDALSYRRFRSHRAGWASPSTPIKIRGARGVPGSCGRTKSVQAIGLYKVPARAPLLGVGTRQGTSHTLSVENRGHRVVGAKCCTWNTEHTTSNCREKYLFAALSPCPVVVWSGFSRDVRAFIETCRAASIRKNCNGRRGEGVGTTVSAECASMSFGRVAAVLV